MTAQTPRWPAQGPGEIGRLFQRLCAPGVRVDEYRALREEIIEANLPLVGHLARRLSARQGCLEDLTQIGAVGLIKAVDRFEPGTGREFVTYAAPVILAEIKRYLRDVGSPPRPMAIEGGHYAHVETGADVGGAVARLTEQERLAVRLRFEGGNTQAEIAALLGLSQVHVSRLLRDSLTRMRLMLE